MVTAAAERQAGEQFRTGYQEAVAEAVRFLVDVQGFGPGDGLCVQLAAHMQRHCEQVTNKGWWNWSIAAAEWLTGEAFRSK